MAHCSEVLKSGLVEMEFILEPHTTPIKLRSVVNLLLTVELNTIKT
jgi:hypothetical protein